MKFTTSLLSALILGVLIFPVFAFAAVPSNDLSFGFRGTDVAWLQEFLISKNQGGAAQALAAAGASGYFGSLTRAALAEYQAVHSISPAAGYFGAKTRAFIGTDSVAEGEVFTGKITAVRTDCFADGVCSVTVDGKEVILLAGMRVGEIPPVGTLEGVESIGDLEKEIGSSVKVYAAPAADGEAEYTLYGNADFYVQLLTPVPADGKVSIKGTIGCLPPKDPTKPTIALCAFGLKAEDGNYYALQDTDEDYENISGVASGETVLVEGEFTAQTHQTWDSVGVIDVADIEEGN